jgi:hypothetical protein
MRYDEFRDKFQLALQNIGLFSQTIGHPTETVELGTMARRWKVYLAGSSTTSAEPFYVTAKLSFNWNPYDSARSYTCEEDLLTELLGREKNRSKTKPRLTRMDLELYARLPYGSASAIPEARTFSSWVYSVKKKLNKPFNQSKWRKDRLVAILGALEEINIESKCDSTGHLAITGISIAGFLMARVPRAWNDSARPDVEKKAMAELNRLAQKFKQSIDVWNASIAELARWIRCAPPHPDAKRVAPFFDEQDEEIEGQPETVH